MGETWSEPIITKIRVRVNANDNAGAGFERWVAIVGAGYDKTINPNDKANYSATSLAGRALFVVDIQTGKNAGIRVFAIPTGNTGREDLVKAQHFVIMNRLLDLLSLV